MEIKNIDIVLEKAIDKARLTMKNNEGGPFGAAILDSKNEIICITSNQVLKKNDPTAHAEVEAIRDASKILGTHDLTGCKIYSTCEPCPMCLSAIIWANIKDVYYGATKVDAAKIGFRDSMIYDYLDTRDANILNAVRVENSNCQKLFDEYEEMKKEIY